MEDLSTAVIKLLKAKFTELGIDLTSSPWTVYSAIFARDKINSKLELISFGSGIKCLPDILINNHPESLVHDMHAEVLCRRAFISFIFNQLVELNENNNTKINNYLRYDQLSEKHYWNDDLELLFYTSQSPCGDASIFKSLLINSSEGKRRRICGNSMLAAGRETDLLGILRTKPGRADSPFASSLSCSDKICSWSILGIQGALLSCLVKPIYFDCVLIGDDFDRESVERALVTRISDFEIQKEFQEQGFKNNSTKLIIIKSSGLDLKPGDSDENSSFWHIGLSAVGKIVLGFKKGSKRPKKETPFGLSLQSPLSRQYFFEKYYKILKKNTSASYIEEKCRASHYQKAKKLFFEHGPFKEWLVRCQKMKCFRDKIF